MTFVRRSVAVAAAGAFMFVGMAVPARASTGSVAAPQPTPPNAPYSGAADASLIRLSGDLLGINLATLDLTRTTAVANTATTPRTVADAKNTGTLTAVSGAVDLTDLLAQAHQEAPPDNAAPVTETILPINLPGLLDAGVSNASAEAHWAGDGLCVAADRPLSQAINDVANLGLISIPGISGVVAVNNDRQGVSFTRSTMSLPSIPGGDDARAVRAEALTHIEDIDVLAQAAGQPPVLSISTAQDYTATATATGLPGGASVNLDDPVLDISLGGNPVIRLSAGQSLTSSGDPTLDGLLDTLGVVLGPLADLGVLSITVPTPTRVVSPDGTSASITGALAEVTVLSALGTPLINLQIAPYSASATAPAGGLNCNPNPGSVVKDAPATVRPGSSFTQTITITNVSCPSPLVITGATDVISGPGGTTITATDPAAASVTGTADQGGITITWGDLGTVAPGATKVLTVVVKVGSDVREGARFTDNAVANYTCEGRPSTGSGSLDRPSVASVLPITGGEDTLVLMGAAALLAAALGVRRLRRA
ncbi:MAG: hypothetical protein ACT4PW_04240 [Acidimicrobiia bacterium]